MIHDVCSHIIELYQRPVHSINQRQNRISPSINGLVNQSIEHTFNPLTNQAISDPNYKSVNVIVKNSVSGLVKSTLKAANKNWLTDRQTESTPNNHSINKLTNKRWMSESINQSISQSVNRCIDESMYNKFDLKPLRSQIMWHNPNPINYKCNYRFHSLSQLTV